MKPKGRPAEQREGVLHPAVSLLERTFLYQFSWPRLLQSHLILGAALLISVALNLILAGRHPKPQYFAMDAQGRIVALVPLAEPMVSTDTVLQFAQGCITASFSLDFDDNNLRKQLQSLHRCYTGEGYRALMAEMDASGLIAKIRTQRLVASAVATGAGVIAQVDPKNPQGYKWTVQQPISITLVNQTERRSYEYVIESDIQRIPTVDNPRGIAVAALRILGDGS
ncbi:TraM-like protein similar to IcmL/DotI genes [Candidatus Glomeribacter gigasporarum BEG34]|uniref:TraM-like protein similar to IcmL/DotI genes n=1 Tax=Candidatus Glomeribacter gigasporarum BEG34 TaxID=1070319 RepID=G2J845_9BURK|nr:DotI/IcmL family type IV secretion protein [Candidatus Glomeribacter gigasporarum]CCD28942.1 TraM-like protein similar to IcmL/DotI genes [Candidatus Glomeribacter gigasporarum BEG34]